jgi:integrase
MPKYKFKTQDGARLPHGVQVTLVGGVLRVYHRASRSVIPGAVLRAGGVIQLSRSWWATYFHHEKGAPLPERDDDAPVEHDRVVPKSWDALIAHFRENNRKFLRNSVGTQQGTGIYLDKISIAFGKLNVAKTLETDAIETLIRRKEFGDPAKGIKARPAAALHLYTAFSLLCEHARKQLKWIETNPLRDTDKPKTLNPEGHATWKLAEVEAFRAACPDDLSSYECRLIEMATAWGCRTSDLLDLGWKNVDPTTNTITFTPRKTKRSTGAKVTLPVTGERLLAVLDHCPKDDTYFFQKHRKSTKVVDLRPQPLGYKRLRQLFDAVIAKAGLRDGLVMHGLRKFFATTMADNGADVQGIADALGDTLESAQVYIRERDAARSSMRAAKHLHRAA